MSHIVGTNLKFGPAKFQRVGVLDFRKTILLLSKVLQKLLTLESLIMFASLK